MLQAGLMAELAEEHVYPKCTQLEGVWILQGVVGVEMLMQVQEYIAKDTCSGAYSRIVTTSGSSATSTTTKRKRCNVSFITLR